MFLHNNNKIKKNKNIFTSLRKILGFKNNYYNLILKKLGLNINNNNINKLLLLLNNKMIIILKKNLLNEKNLVLNILKEKKNNINNKLNKFPLIKFKYLKGYPIRGQKTRNNIKTTKKLRFK